MAWTIGDVDASQTLTNNDHLFPVFFNELRKAGLDSVRNAGYFGTTNTDVEIQAAIDDLP